jgi:hypothetical protein
MAMSPGKTMPRTWWGVGVKKRPVRKKCYGFTVQVTQPDGTRKQIRRFDSAWQTEEQAADALALFRLGLAPEEPVVPTPIPR